MPKRRNGPGVGNPAVTPRRGAEFLSNQITKGKHILREKWPKKKEYRKWETKTLHFLILAFGEDNQNVTRVMNIGKMVFGINESEDSLGYRMREDLESQIAELEALVDVLHTKEMIQNEAEANQPVNKTPKGSKIFLVHGHDDAVLKGTALFLEKLGLSPIILHEEPSRGQTIIEKFEACSDDVGFAIVLLTPDDRGGQKDVSWKEQSYRARQNVILELGYFFGRLGREHVCALYTHGVEIPSDFSGVLWVEFDKNEGWQKKLAKELMAAGFSVDLNKIL